MKKTDEKKDNLPDSFSSYEEAGEFWDNHDSMDYIEHLIPVYEIEIDGDLFPLLKEKATSLSEPVGILVNEILRDVLQA